MTSLFISEQSLRRLFFLRGLPDFAFGFAFSLSATGLAFAVADFFF